MIKVESLVQCDLVDRLVYSHMHTPRVHHSINFLLSIVSCQTQSQNEKTARYNSESGTESECVQIHTGHDIKAQPSMLEFHLQMSNSVSTLSRLPQEARPTSEYDSRSQPNSFRSEQWCSHCWPADGLINLLDQSTSTLRALLLLILYESHSPSCL